MIETWEKLQEDIQLRLNQCQAFNKINKDLEILSLKVDNITAQKHDLESIVDIDAEIMKDKIEARDFLTEHCTGCPKNISMLLKLVETWGHFSWTPCMYVIYVPNDTDAIFSLF